VTRPVAGHPLKRDVHLLVLAEHRYSSALDAFVKIARIHDWRGGFPCAEGAAATVDQTDRSGRQGEDGRLATA
jgi:hypothetical protein